MKILNYEINFPVKFPSINYEWINFVEKISRRIPRKDIWFSSLFGIDFTYNFDKRWKSNINIYIYQLDLFIDRPSKGVNDLSKTYLKIEIVDRREFIVNTLQITYT